MRGRRRLAGAACAVALLSAACAPVQVAKPDAGPPATVVAAAPAEPSVEPPVASAAIPPESSPPATAPATDVAVPVAGEPPSDASGGPVTASPLPTNVTATGAEVFARLRRRLRSPMCVDSAGAREWQRRYAGHPATFARRIEAVLPMLDFVVAETEASGLPGEFAFIPLVESWYEPGAVGRGGPSGMWQMIGSTARNHGIRMGTGYDGRLSPVESTRAALSYLHTLDDMFNGDWQATVMAYNAGEGRLAAALRRSGSRVVAAEHGQPAGLSRITYDYVSKLQALSCLVGEPARNGLSLPDAARFERLGAVHVGTHASSLEQVARRARVPAERLRELNPAYRGGRFAGDVPRLVLMPLSAGATLATATGIEEEAAAEDPAAVALVQAPAQASANRPATGADTGTHRVCSGDTLSHIARRYGVPLGALLKLNRLGSKSRIHPGQVLRLVP